MLHYSLVMQMQVKDGRLVLPSGMSYAVLELPDTDRMRPELMKKIVELKKAGAMIYVPRLITAAPGIKGDAEVAKLTSELPVVGVDVPYPPEDVKAPEGVVWAHRRAAGKEIYFVSNQQQREVTVPLSAFRAKGEAEIWRTIDGRIERAGEKVAIGPSDSVFVVFVEKSEAPPAKKFVASGEKIVAGPWTVKFPFGDVEMSRPKSWAESADERIRYFSGTATYAVKFEAPADVKSAMLDLGDVAVMATVKLNGKDLGLLWKPPFVADVSDAIRAGENDLEISVTNTWANRLIGDERYPDIAEYRPATRGRGEAIAKIPDWLLKGKKMPPTTRQTFVTWKHYRKDDPLQPAGLIGPVLVKFGQKK
jgi:hypothetical protein